MDSPGVGSGADPGSGDGACEPRSLRSFARAGNFYFAAAVLLLCAPSILGDGGDRKIYVEGAAQIAASPDFTNQEQLRELLQAIEEKDRLIALLSGCIESPEAVHVELGLDKISNGGKHLALVSASYSSNDQVQGTLGILAPMRMHYERVITAVAFMAQFFSENQEGG